MGEHAKVMSAHVARLIISDRGSLAVLLKLTPREVVKHKIYQPLSIPGPEHRGNKLTLLDIAFADICPETYGSV